MMLLRSATDNDLDAIHRLALSSGIGITTLPKEIELLKKRLAWSTTSFKKDVLSPKNEYYLFVLEDPKNGQIVGTSAIESATGHDAPFYSYKLSKRTRICFDLNIRSDYEVLILVNDYQGYSEICTLFLNPDYRVNSNGLLLSRSRFLFIAQFPERFAPTIIAEMRGVSDDQGHSPFWDQVGSHFFHMPFVEADRLTLSTNKQFIADLMPRHPLYVKILSKDAQAVIGKPHPLSLPAMNILLKEGFRYTHYVDIFDAGPTIEAPRDQIRTVATSLKMVVKNIIDEVGGERYIIANNALNFRATISHALFNQTEQSCTITRQTADMLQVKCGDLVRLSHLGTSK